ncbi:transcriptional regulator [Pokkaliibacter plantistimulans]|uniref:Transcriptional regulator n=1 Tax=Proteobacteria bacterium 228 TaxID=2083153 RepID=A0A2S5KPA4_9PROT|nr:Rrf2 family transcriptional regulator [Pokkaliibacter plantistimulans]PPC76465.1 transcriptional regulator [Pokkaliibacter plantistimulans]
MRTDNRLSRMLHVLLHMQQHDCSATSDSLAQMLNTHPVVVRRTMASLKQQGYVDAIKGHGGGWTLSCDFEQVTLLDIYRALGESPVFALGLSIDNPDCLIEQAVNAALAEAMQQAEAVLIERLGHLTLAELARGIVQKIGYCAEPQPAIDAVDEEPPGLE